MRYVCLVNLPIQLSLIQIQSLAQNPGPDLPEEVGLEVEWDVRYSIQSQESSVSGSRSSASLRLVSPKRLVALASPCSLVMLPLGSGWYRNQLEEKKQEGLGGDMKRTERG